MTERSRRICSYAVVAIGLTWLGLDLGVAFIATPAKFLAPSLELPVALDVGQHTFHVFNAVEWVLVLVLLTLVMSGDVAPQPGNWKRSWRDAEGRR